ncbi:hypothetical protein F66182_4491 [Fusarium sp. NRRL 66182]|nr:hypothetical protein F66182_4491 [Fusarium sp. NRRL 66182]
MEPGRYTTLVMNPLKHSEWTCCMRSLDVMLAQGEVDTCAWSAAVSGLVRQKPAGVGPQFIFHSQRIVARMLLGTCPPDSNGFLIATFPFKDLGTSWLNETDLRVLSRVVPQIDVMQYMLYLCAFIDGLVNKFNLIRPFGQTCLTWNMDRWPKERYRIRGGLDSYFGTLNKLMELDTKTKQSGLARCFLYWDAAFCETCQNLDLSRPEVRRFLNEQWTKTALIGHK